MPAYLGGFTSSCASLAIMLILLSDYWCSLGMVCRCRSVLDCSANQGWAGASIGQQQCVQDISDYGVISGSIWLLL